MNYPEHDKLSAVQDESQAIGEFLDNSRYTLCEYREPPEDVPEFVHAKTGEPAGMFDTYAVANPDWFPARLYPVQRAIPDILAEWFDIDQGKLEAEKRQMLEELRAANA